MNLSYFIKSIFILTLFSVGLGSRLCKRKPAIQSKFGWPYMDPSFVGNPIVQFHRCLSMRALFPCE